MVVGVCSGFYQLCNCNILGNPFELCGSTLAAYFCAARCKRHVSLQPEKSTAGVNLNCFIVDELLQLRACLMVELILKMKREANNRKKKDKTAMNNNSIIAPVFCLLSLIFLHFSNLISQGTTMRWQELFPCYHPRDHSSAGGINEEGREKSNSFIRCRRASQ